jgi:hypothetical protein
MALKIDALEGPPTHNPPEHRTLLPGIRVLGLAPQQLRKPGDVPAIRRASSRVRRFISLSARAPEGWIRSSQP